MTLAELALIEALCIVAFAGVVAWLCSQPWRI